MTSKSRVIGIFGGTGALGSALSKKWSKAGHQIIIGSRNADKAISVAEEARKSFPEQPEYLRLLFHLNWVAGDREKALNHFIELLDRYHDSYQKTQIAGI